jgi:hypothetical protein
LTKYNWSDIQDRANELSGPISTLQGLADALDLPRSTLGDALRRGAIKYEFAETECSESVEEVAFVENGNEAVLKFNSAEPLTALEAAEIAGVDLDIWEISKQRVNMWQGGRKHKVVKLDYVDGSATGFVDDDGEWNKTYFYQIDVEFTRKVRVAVSLVLQPIEVVSHPLYLLKELAGASHEPRPLGSDSVLFICDPHFGYKGKEPFHNRQFISDLLSIQHQIMPLWTVWNGDALDLADFGSFPNDPAITQKTQAAAVEFAWVLRQFNSDWGKQVLIEGNHEVRLRKAMLKNLAAGYDLRPVHELDGESLLSVPRLLGLKEMDIEWVGDYPNGYFQFGNARFRHGNVAKANPGSTAQAVINKTVISTFFGHIHRYELLSRTMDGMDGLIWSGSPGCATSMTITPGVTANSNWSTGAFLVSFEEGRVVAVEHIFHENDRTYFRGSAIKSVNYSNTNSFFEQVGERYDL